MLRCRLFNISKRHFETEQTITQTLGDIVKHPRQYSPQGWGSAASATDTETATQRTDDINVLECISLPSPINVKRAQPISERATRTVLQGRDTFHQIMSGVDRRFVMVIGPCSIHDEDMAIDYAKRLSTLRQEVQDRLVIIMRVYFEKPRTTVGWKGLINDPHLNGSFDMASGINKARRILMKITEMGLPTATEMLDPITPQYIADLIVWSSIGARTTESQTHRQMASGLSMPVGFKNGTDGNLDVAINAMMSARSPHAFLGVDGDGRTCIVRTRGNVEGHLILRGGSKGTNYDMDSVNEALTRLNESRLPTSLVIDCSHANSHKKAKNQHKVLEEVLNQRIAGNQGIMGVMLESNINEGAQKFKEGMNPDELDFGVSLTDECIGWEETESLIRDTYGRLG